MRRDCVFLKWHDRSKSVMSYLRWQVRHTRIQIKPSKQDAGHSLPHCQSSGTSLSFCSCLALDTVDIVSRENRERPAIIGVRIVTRLILWPIWWILRGSDCIWSSFSLLSTWSLGSSREPLCLLLCERGWLRQSLTSQYFMCADFSSIWALSSRPRCCRCC